MRPRVFLIEIPRRPLDTSGAAEFGDIVLIFGPEDRRCSIFDAAEFGNQVLVRLDEMQFNPEHDWLCVAGSMVTTVLVTAAALARYRRLRLLLYNATLGHYVERPITIEEWETADAKSDI